MFYGQFAARDAWLVLIQVRHSYNIEANYLTWASVRSEMVPVTAGMWLVGLV